VSDFQFGNAIATGDSIPTTFRYYKFRVPDADWIIAAALGQFLMQVYESGWWQSGAVFPDDAAEVFQRIQQSVVELPNPIGSIIAYASSLPATASIMACNGDSLLRSAYPDLFAAIGTTWGAADIAHFNVPDLRGRTLVDSGTGSGLSNRVPGQTFGEEDHQLTTAELASHTHSEGSTLPSVAQTPITPIATAVGFSSVTGSTGGDTAHNNMQPSAVIVYGIIAL